VQCVCVCIYAHVHLRALPPASKIEKTQDNPSISPTVKSNPPRQATNALHKLVQHPHPRPQTRMKIRERMCTPCSDCVADKSLEGDVKNTCRMYKPTCTSAQDTCLVHTAVNANAKMHIHQRKHSHAITATPSPCKPLRLILQLEFCPRNRHNPRQPMAQPQKSCHKGVISDHPPGCGPHLVCLWFALPLAAAEIRHHKILFPPFLRGFLNT